MAGEFAIIHPPSRLGTVPYRALVPRLKGQTSSEMTWIGTDWHRYPQSEPIRANLVPIRCQSYVITEAIPALNLGTSALYGEVPSLLGG